MALDRRGFLKTSALGLAGTLVLGSCVGNAGKGGKKPQLKTNPFGDVINVGAIGLGRQSLHVSRGFTKIKNVKIVGCADVYKDKCTRYVNEIGESYRKQGIESDIKIYDSYESLIADPDIHAVIIATPDHWHAAIAIAALNAGKDVYLEKPLTFTIFEGQELVKAVRNNNRILQVGSQQRSDAAFQHAVKMVQEGKLGKIHKIKAKFGAPPTPYDLPRTRIPEGLDWDKWLGPLPLYVHYNDDLNPPISLDPKKNEHCWGAWRWYRETGGGFTTDWGAHMIDIAQWAVGMDGRGPVKVIPAGVDGAEFLTWVYDNGVVMTEEPLPVSKENGVRFEGEKGWIEVTRKQFHASDPSLMFVREKGNADYEEAPAHYQTFIDSVRSRKDPNCPVEVGHSTCTACTLGNIAHEVKHAIEWDPDKQVFVNDDELMKHRLVKYTYREGYTLG